MRIFILLAFAVCSTVIGLGCTSSSSYTSQRATVTAINGTAVASAPATGTATAAIPASASASAALSSTPGADSTAANTPITADSAGGQVEVTGIVGGINASTRTIEIRRLRGASVTKIEVGDSTKIRKAAGGTIPLADVRVSDRIIATGALNDRKDALVATEITVQDVVPGAQPGG